jgi:hypothetical protein
MSHVSPLGRRAFAGCVLTILCLLSAGQQLTAGQNPFKKILGGDKGNSYQTFKDSAGRFELEYPTKDWHLLPSGGSSLAVLARNDGPTLFVDYLKLADRLTPGEIDAMPEMEVGRLKEQQPNAKDFKFDMVETKAGRGVLIRYSRVGTVPESVVQYSILVGQDLFRLNGIVPARLLSKYEPIIMHMIQSFKAPADPSSPKN